MLSKLINLLCANHLGTNHLISRKILVTGLVALCCSFTACGGGGSGTSASSKAASSVSIASASSTSSSALSSSNSSASNSSTSTLSSEMSSSAMPSAESSSAASSIYSANVDHLRDLASFPIGVAVSNNDSPGFNILTNGSEQAVVEQHFSQMTAGNIMKVSYLHPGLDTFSFANADAFVDYAKAHDMKVHGHALVWHSSYQVPDFMKNWSGTAADFLTMLETHVTTIVNHFKDKGTVVSWDVVNEAINDNSPAEFRTDSTFYIKSGNSAEYIERAFKAARLADPNAILYYNDYSTENNGAKTDKLIAMISDFQTRAIPIDGVGFQMHICLNWPDASTIAAALKKVVDKGLIVKISELDVAINNPWCDNYPANKVSSFSEAAALAQKKRYCEVIKAYLDTVPVNQRGGITVWGTTDANTWLNDLYKTQFDNAKIAWPLLFDDNYNDKPALRGFADALTGASCTANY